MQINKEVLSEKNYTGTRLIPLVDAQVVKFKKELGKFQKQANPFLKKMESYTKVLDPFYKQIAALEEQKKKIQEQMRPTKELYDIELKKVELIDQKAALVKQKIQPLVANFVKDKLSEFEVALQLIEKNNMIYIEVADKLEEFIKSYRSKNK